jgi:hypothetical protein
MKDTASQKYFHCWALLRKRVYLSVSSGSTILAFSRHDSIFLFKSEGEYNIWDTVLLRYKHTLHIHGLIEI